MRIPYSWLSEFVELSDTSPEEIADRLSLQSVEAFVDTFGVELKGVVLGKVLETQVHPKREDLVVVKLSTDRGQLQVITADTTLSTGDVVVVAPVGARVGENRVEKRVIEGVNSEGVLLSTQDLGLEESSQGVLKIREEVSLNDNVEELLGLGEPLIELDITPNRGDVLSVRGLARDIAAIFGLPKREPGYPIFEISGELSLKVEDADCKRYRGAVIEGLKVEESPLWLKRRLWQSGIKSINNVVDITNYILLRDGQPLHAFDLDKLKGGIVVRSARKGERILALDSREYELSEDILVIADESVPVAIAGVIGGLESSVSWDTKNVLLEAAYFSPERVRKASKGLGIQTDSSYRFERNTDIEHLEKAQNYALELMLRLAGGSLKAVRDHYPEPYRPKRIFLSAGKYERYSGEDYDTQEAVRILSSLEIPCSPKECGLEAEVPAHRSFDISRDVDLIEEIMRIRGYESYESDILHLPVKGKLKSERLEELRRLCRDKGLREVINIPFEDEKLYELLGLEVPSVSLLNPLVPSQRFMRSSLIPSLIRNARDNLKSHNQEVAIFEIGKVYSQQGEETRLGVLLSGLKSLYPKEENWSHLELLELLYSISELASAELEPVQESLPFMHPFVSATLHLEGNRVGYLGKLSPKLSAQLELNSEVYLMELNLEPLLSDKLKSYKPMSKFPPAIRDLAILVDKDVSVLKLINEIKSHIKGTVEEVMVFDFYTGEKLGEGKKSVGVRLILRSYEKSLTDEEVNGIIDNLLRRLRDSLGATLR